MSLITQSKTNWKFVLIIVILAAVIGGGILYFSQQKILFYQPPEINLIKKQPVAGGPCSSKSFMGECTITSIVGEDVVRFKFNPTETLNLQGTFVENESDIINRENEMYAGYLGLGCLGSKYPLTLADLTKCYLKKDEVFTCQIEIITNGTCTPIGFSFKERVILK